MRLGQTGVLIAVVYFTIFGAVHIWRAMFYNHALGDLEAEPGQIAMVFSWLALPGVLAFLVGYLLKRFSFRAIIGVSAFLVGGGMVWIGLAPSLKWMSPGLFALGLGPILFYPIAVRSTTIAPGELGNGRGGRLAVVTVSAKLLPPKLPIEPQPVKHGLQRRNGVPCRGALAETCGDRAVDDQFLQRVSFRHRVHPPGTVKLL